MKMLLYVTCALLPFTVQAAPAAKISLAKLHSSYKDATSVEADFIQEVYQASLGRTKTSKGNLKLAKPNLVRWEIYEPEASIMVSNGRKVSYFTPNARGKGKGQVIEHKAADLESQPLFRILTGASALDEEFTIVKLVEADKKDPKSLTQFTLKPKKPLNDLEQVILKVNAKYLIEELILVTQSGNKTKFSLQNQALGAKFPAQLFDFKPPADTEVVRN